MSGQQVTSTFGPNNPTRIAGSTELMTEPGEIVPGLLTYQPLVPFVSPEVVSGSGSSSTTTDMVLSDEGYPIWQRTPSRCDLLFWQGDDVVIPLYFNDPTIANDDMATGWQWHAEIRRYHNYNSTLINDFQIAASFNTGIDETDENTLVEMFLPRTENTVSGIYRWEIYSISPADFTRFPKPPAVAAAAWPPKNELRSWLYGWCKIVPRTSATDILPVVLGDGAVVVTTGGFFAGPNGRVP
jgi:hypothetical protein